MATIPLIRAAVAVPSWRPKPLTLVLLAQLVAMTALAGVLGTWVDEEYTLASTAHGPLYAIGRALGFEQQAPLYFVLVALLREIAPSVLAARLFSVVCALGVTLAAAAIARRLRPAADPWPFALFVAFNPFVVYAALEIRLYALALLVSGMLWLTFYDGFLQGERSDRRTAFVCLAIASLYLEYFLAFELLGFALALVIAGRWRALRAYVVAGAICIAAFVPMLFILYGQIHGAFGVAPSRPPPLQAVFLHPILDFVVPYDYAGLAGSHWIDGALVLAAIVAVVFGGPCLDRRTVALGATVACIEAIYVVLVDVLHEPLVVPRHFVALFIPEVAFAYALLATFADRPRAAAARRTIAALVAFATALSLGYTYRAMAKLGDWPRVGAWLQAHASRSDTIAIFAPDLTLPFERYYHGAAHVVPIPHAPDPSVYSVGRLMVHSKAEAFRAFADLPKTGNLWFVQYDTCNARDYFGCDEIDAVVRERYRVAERHDFFRTRVERLVPRSRQAR